MLVFVVVVVVDLCDLEELSWELERRKEGSCNFC